MQGEWTGELAGPDVWVTSRELIPASSVFTFLAEHREVLFPAVCSEQRDEFTAQRGVLGNRRAEMSGERRQGLGVACRRG